MIKQICLIYSLLAICFLTACSPSPQHSEVLYTKTSQMNQQYPISIIYVDAKTELALGDFPIDRRHYASIVEVLNPARPKYVVLKYFLIDPSKSDAELAKTLSKYENTLTQAAAVDVHEDYSKADLEKHSIEKNTFKFYEHKAVWFPNTHLANKFNGIGFVNSIIKDGKFMEFLFIVGIEKKLYPSLALLILEKELKEKLSISKNSVSTSKFEVPINKNGSFSIDLSEPNSLYPSYSFIDVLQGKVALEKFENNIVIVFYKGEKIQGVSSEYGLNHNPAEIVADSINTALKYLSRANVNKQ